MIFLFKFFFFDMWVICGNFLIFKLLLLFIFCYFLFLIIYNYDINDFVFVYLNIDRPGWILLVVHLFYKDVVYLIIVYYMSFVLLLF